MAAGDMKGDNFGSGLSTDLFDAITGDLSGSNARGTGEEQAAVLLELVREERAARYPGNGTASLADAMVKYIAIEQAAAEVSAVSPGQSTPGTAAINKLAQAISALGTLWTDYGPVPGGFSDSVKNKR